MSQIHVSLYSQLLRKAFEIHISEETRRDIVLIVIFSLVSAIGMASFFWVIDFSLGS